VCFYKFTHHASAFPYLTTAPVYDEARIITQIVTINGSPKEKCAARTQDDPFWYPRSSQLARRTRFRSENASLRQRPAGPRKAHVSSHWAACSILAVLERSRGRRRTLYFLVVFAWSRGPHWGYRLSWGCSKAGRKLRSFGRPWNLFKGVDPLLVRAPRTTLG
jgi:hypothetical protein